MAAAAANPEGGAEDTGTTSALPGAAQLALGEAEAALGWGEVRALEESRGRAEAARYLAALREPRPWAFFEQLVRTVVARASSWECSLCAPGVRCGACAAERDWAARGGGRAPLTPAMSAPRRSRRGGSPTAAPGGGAEERIARRASSSRRHHNRTRAAAGGSSVGAATPPSAGEAAGLRGGLLEKGSSGNM